MTFDFGGDQGTNPEFEFDPNAPLEDQLEFLEQEFGDGSGASSGGGDVINNVGKVILSELRGAADALGQNPIVFEQLFEQFEREFWTDVSRDVFQNFMLRDPSLLEGGNNFGFFEGDLDAMNFLTTPEGFNELLTYSRWWWGSKIPGVADVWGGTSSPSGGSGSGRARPSFDLAQLANRVTDLYRAYLMTEPEGARGKAQAYVDAVLRNPDQPLDFDTFILGHYIQKEARYASIYRDKPESMSEQQFLGPYVSLASQVLRPKNQASAAIGGAQFGASAQQFQDRLTRSNEFRTSSPFLNSLEGRMRSLRGVLKG